MNAKELKEEKELETDVGVSDLSSYMEEVIKELQADKKYPAVHTYLSTLHSFVSFYMSLSDSREPSLSSGTPLSSSTLLPLSEVFTPGRLKEYENWLMGQELGLNSISTYMRTLRAVYNRWCPPGSPKHLPKLFDDVYTKVTSQTKRALTEQQLALLIQADLHLLPKEQRRALAYFLLMFFLRGMPFIDLAHLRKKDLQDNKIIYCRHKTGKQITVRIPSEALPLISAYRDRNSDSIYLFPILDSRLANSFDLYKCYLDALRRFNKSLHSAVQALLPGVKASSYTARHSWATVAYHKGMPLGIISQSLGHSSIRVTETYLKPFENEQVDKENRKLISFVKKRKWMDCEKYNML